MRVLPLVVLFLTAFRLAAPSARADTVVVHASVFEDLDSDGADSGEPPLSGIRVTDGLAVHATDAAGQATFVVDRSVYRFATLTVPSGYRTTNPWFVHLDGPADTVSVAFGLQADPASAADPIRWVHIADTQVQTWGDPWRMDDVLREVNGIPTPPLFLFNTGDLVEVGSDSTHWNNYHVQLAVSDYEVLPVVGNHDTLSTPSPLDAYEANAGPPYYSREAGNWHFIVYNSEVAWLGTPMQDAWFDADVAATPPGMHIVALQHRMANDAPAERNLHWAALGVEANFSGHWHALQFSRERSGILDYNLSRTRSGPTDHTPQVFGVVSMYDDGRLEYDLRRVHVDHRAALTYPADGLTVAAGEPLEALAQAYDSSSPVVSVTAAVSGPGGSVPPAPLAKEGVSLWRGDVDVSALPPGAYEMTVTALFDDGTVTPAVASFRLDDIVPIVRQPGEDWPMFRRCAAGSSATATALGPPLELAWTTPVPGMVALSSPVVADGVVYLGTRAEHVIGEEGVIACDAATGAPLWQRHVPGGVALAPAVANGVVLASSMSDSVWALDAATGTPLWSREILFGEYGMAAPVFEGDVTWIGPEPRPMQLRVASGAADWLITPRIGNAWFPYVYTAPAVSAERVYFSFHGFDLYGGGFAVANRATGAREYLEIGTHRSPIWTGDALYLIGGTDKNDQRLTRRDATGAVQWLAATSLGSGTGSPAIAHGVLVAAGVSGAVQALSAADGAALWSHPVGQSLYSMVAGLKWTSGTSATPAIADDVVYVGSLDGNLYALDLFTGEELWAWQFGVPVASSAAISGNMLFVGASDGHLYAFASRSSAVGVPAPAAPGGALRLDRVRPNPGREESRVRWAQPREGRVRIAVFDAAGRRVRQLLDEVRDAGDHEVAWDGRTAAGTRAAAGVYFVRLRFEGEERSGKVVRLAGF